MQSKAFYYILIFFFVPAFKIDLIRGFQCNYIMYNLIAYKFQYSKMSYVRDFLSQQQRFYLKNK